MSKHFFARDSVYKRCQKIWVEVYDIKNPEIIPQGSGITHIKWTCETCKEIHQSNVMKKYVETEN